MNALTLLCSTATTVTHLLS